MTQPLFEVTSRVTRGSCCAQARAKAGRRHRMIWFAIILMALSVVVLWTVGSPHAWWTTVLLGVLLMESLLRVRLDGWRIYLSRNESVQEVRMAFSEKRIEVKTRVEKTKISYDSVQELFEDRRYLVILLRNHTPLVVLRADVPDDQSEQLQELLQTRTGLAFRKLKL